MLFRSPPTHPPTPPDQLPPRPPPPLCTWIWPLIQSFTRGPATEPALSWVDLMPQQLPVQARLAVHWVQLQGGGRVWGFRCTGFNCRGVWVFDLQVCRVQRQGVREGFRLLVWGSYTCPQPGPSILHLSESTRHICTIPPLTHKASMHPPVPHSCPSRASWWCGSSRRPAVAPPPGSPQRT